MRSTTLLLFLAGCELLELPKSTDGDDDPKSTTEPADGTTGDTGTAPDPVPSGDGSCPPAATDALPVHVSGEDFHADHADQIRFSEAECVQLRFGDPHPERIQEVSLAAGQTVGACERGAMPAALYVVDACTGDEPGCLVAASEVGYGGEHACVRYTAEQAETVFVVVESYNTTAGESAFGYDIEIGLDPTCGDGVREPGEECDDGNATDWDGCSACFIDLETVCYELGGPSTCVPMGCGDGCVFGDLSSDCSAPSNDIAQEECDDLNNASGDGCSADCDVEEGYNCSAAQTPSTCWPEPSYADLVPTSPDITDTRPGMRITSYHELHVTVAEPLTFTIEVEAFGVGTHPDDLMPDVPVEVTPEVWQIGTTSNLFIGLRDGSAVLDPGTYLVKLRAGADRVGEYSYSISLDRP